MTGTSVIAAILSVHSMLNDAQAQCSFKLQ